VDRFGADGVLLTEKPAASEVPVSPVVNAIPFQFTGSAGDYFRIWAPNVLLSVITLGLYSPWAKVRRTRYFYGNTHVNGSSFSYHASPIAILKGRLLVYGVLLAAAVVNYLAPATGQAMYITFGLAAPALLVKALRFRNRNTGYRGIRFDFDGDMRDAYRVYLWLGALVVPTLGLLLPYVVAAQRNFVANNTRYGSTPFRLDLTWQAVVRVFAISIALLLVVGVVAIVFVLGVIAMLPGVAGVGDGAEPAVTAAAAIISLMVPLLFIGSLAIVSAYFQTAVTNLVWNNVTLVERDVDLKWMSPPAKELARFASRLEPSHVIWIYVTNLLAILASAGLAVPWARIRLARYRVESLSLYPSDDLDRLIADQTQVAPATGSEFADAVGLDIGL
jgi:uncharacterized membrane protein YjgN (DUF898 family)